MSKRKKKKKQHRPKQKAPSSQPSTAAALKDHKPIWKKLPSWALNGLSVFGVVVGLLAALFGFYPSLSINKDDSYDNMFPYNTSFSITNDGFWPVADLSITCSADFIMLPWTNDPADKSQMDLHTQDSEYKDFAKLLTYKHRLTLPCNHNVIANGHRIAPDAKLHIKIVYRFAGTKIKGHKNFELRTVMGWNGQQFWQYQ
jgi:hypothetical protein